MTMSGEKLCPLCDRPMSRHPFADCLIRPETGEREPAFTITRIRSILEAEAIGSNRAESIARRIVAHLPAEPLQETGEREADIEALAQALCRASGSIWKHLGNIERDNWRDKARREIDDAAQEAKPDWRCTGCGQDIFGNPRFCPGCNYTVYEPVPKDARPPELLQDGGERRLKIALMERDWLLGAWAAIAGIPQAEAEAEMLKWSEKWRESALDGPLPVGHPHQDVERQEAIDRAVGVMRDSEYVGGPSQRDAWRAIRSVLEPLATEYKEAANPTALTPNEGGTEDSPDEGGERR